MRIETVDHILSAHLWTSTVVGHEVWSNRGSAARDMRRAPGSACARAKLSGSSTAKAFRQGPGRFVRFLKFKFRAAPLFDTKKYKSYKNAFISHPSQPFLKLNEENNGKMMVACK